MSFITDNLSRSKEVVNYLWISDLQTLNRAEGPEGEKLCSVLTVLIHQPPVHIGQEQNARWRLAHSPGVRVLSGPVKICSQRYFLSVPQSADFQFRVDENIISFLVQTPPPSCTISPDMKLAPSDVVASCVFTYSSPSCQFLPATRQTCGRNKYEPRHSLVSVCSPGFHPLVTAAVDGWVYTFHGIYDSVTLYGVSIFVPIKKKTKQGCKYTVYVKDICKELDPELLPLCQKICCMWTAFTDSGHISWLRECICCGISVFRHKWRICPDFHCNHELQIFGCNQNIKGSACLCICSCIYTKRCFSSSQANYFPTLGTRASGSTSAVSRAETWNLNKYTQMTWNLKSTGSNLWHTYFDSSGSAYFLSFLELHWGYISFLFGDMWVWERFNSGRGAWMSACHSCRYLEIVKIQLLQMLSITDCDCHSSLLRRNKS